MEEIRGEIKRIIYRNEENGFTVMELVDGDGDEITAVGPLPLCSVGERVELSGTWTAHKTYGRQFKAEGSKTLAPATLHAVVNYLGGGLIKGVGESTARAIVQTFGMDTLTVMEETPERLTEVPGIGRMRAQTIANSYAAQMDMRDIMMALQEYGVTVTQAIKLYKIYGPLCLGKIRENPYCLIADVESIGFKTADKIAEAAGIEHESSFRMHAGVAYTLQWASREGHTCLPRHKLLEVAQNLLETELLPVERAVDEMILNKELEYKLVEGTDMVFLPVFAYLEQDCAQRLLRFAQTPETPMLGLPAQIAYMEKELHIELAGQQREAVLLAMRSGVLVITGGPGTGKTTILQFIIKLADRLGLTCELCAPTGRAAKRMSEATGCEARTIHRMLEYGYSNGSGFQKNEDDPILTDFLIADEMSMVDVPLMHALLKAAAQGTRLILVGDADQLPSVGPGNVLRDVIASGRVPVVRLTEIYRQSERSTIVLNAHAVNAGQGIDLSNKQDFGFEQIEETEAVIARLIALYGGRTNRLDTRDPLKDVQILSPMKKGALGVYSLNARLQAALNPPQYGKRERQFGDITFREGDKVMQIKNDYRLSWTRRRGRETELGEGVYNGDLGTIMKIDTAEQTILVLFDDAREALYEYTMLEELELAYCISIHKSQGSEFPVVMLPLAGGPPMLMTRNLLYTAITRARRQVMIVGNKESVLRMVHNAQVRARYSALKAFLEQG